MISNTEGTHLYGLVILPETLFILPNKHHIILLRKRSNIINVIFHVYQKIEKEIYEESSESNASYFNMVVGDFKRTSSLYGYRR